jgi:serine-type D-Ala-D-Ala carboxypeptidase (penicillin-binding protein 5/6)
VLNTRRGRGNLIGYGFLGLSVLLTVGTLFLALTEHRVSDLQTLWNSDESNPSSNLTLAELSATADAQITPTPEPAGPETLPEDLELSAEAAYVLHAESGKVLYEREADELRQPASTIKIFTALVVLKYAAPEEVIEVVESDVVDPVAESSMGLQAGDRVTIHDLLVGLMLPSGNDAANALARSIGSRIEGEPDESPEDRFVQEMNQFARDLGIEHSKLLDVSGLDREGQGVTAREMAIATEALLARPSLATVVAMKKAEIHVGGPNARVIDLENTNELLIYGDIFGVKTGTTSEAGQCLIVAQHNGDGATISVLLGSQDRYADARVLHQLPEPPEPVDDADEEPAPEHSEPLEEPTDPEG